MKAIVYDRYGSFDDLEMRDIAKPVIEADEVLVRIRAAALHVGDCFAVRGSPFVMRLAIGLLKPKHGIPGFDGAGEVEAVGATVRNFRRGDAVFGQCDRACAEYAAVNQDKLALKPANLTFEQAAALPTSALAALHALRDVGKVQPGQNVLVNGASGGVGTFAVQIAKSFGADVTGVCSTRNVEMVRSLGADHVIDYTKEDFTSGGRRYDVIFDNVENRSLADCRRALTPSGTLILNSGTGARSIGMPVPTLIRPPTDATPVKATAEVGRARALPDDFLREASARLGIMSLVVAGLWVVGTLLGRLSVQSMRYGASKAVGLTLSDAIAAASVVASLGLFAYTRSAHRNPQRILNLGLVYMVLIAPALGLTFHSGPVLRTLSVAPQISWIGAVILMFSAIVPSTWTKTLLAGFIAASMNPVGMLGARSQGYWDFGPATNALLMHYPDYLLVGVAVVISRVVTTLGRQVARAREMGSYQLGETAGARRHGRSLQGLSSNAGEAGRHQIDPP